jgi:hypothetical protein
VVAGWCAGCQPHAVGVAPAGAFQSATPEAFREAARASLPAGRRVVRFSWRSDDGQLQLAGNGAARFAPPDSLRADMAATMGVGRSTVLLTGDSVLARPPNLADQVLPDRFALWAALGIMRAPAGTGRYEVAHEGTRTLWRLTDAAGRTTTFELDGDALVGVAREAEGSVTSSLRLRRGADGAVRHASVTDLPHTLRLEVEINAWETSDAFPPAIWQLRP